MLAVRVLGVILTAAMVAGCGDLRDVPAAPVGEAAMLPNQIRRLDLRFPCGETTCAAWLYLPSTSTPAPVVVMAHGFAGTRDVALPAFAERFAAAGLTACVFDYRHFGASGGAPRQLVDPWLQLGDWRSAIRFVRGRDDVDVQRIALWGTSLAAGHALILAAEDPEIRAVVVQAPLVDTKVEGEATHHGAGWVIRLLFTGWASLARQALTGSPILVPALAPRGGFGMVVDDVAFAAFGRLVPPESSYRNEVVAHSLFTFDGYDPSDRAPGIRAPILLIASRTDRFAPFSAVEAFAARAFDARVETFAGDHFDVYSPPAAERAAALAASFLVEHLLGGR